MASTDTATEQKAVAFDFKSIDKEGVFEGYASIFGNVDLDNSIVERGAFKKTLQEKDPQDIPVYFDHEKIIGYTLELKETKKGLYTKGWITSDTQAGKETLSLLRNKIVKRMSFAFRIVRDEIIDGIQHIREVNLFEVSVVGIPANPEAVIIGVKRAMPHQDLPLAVEGHGWNEAGARERLESWKDKSRGYLIRGKDDEFSLPIADVIDGELKAVPFAIYAAAVAICAPGGLDISEADAAKIKSHLSRYYEQIKRKPPWDRDKGLDFVELLAAADSEAAFLMLKGEGLDAASTRHLEQTTERFRQALEALGAPSQDTRPAAEEPREVLTEILSIQRNKK